MHKERVIATGASSSIETEKIAESNAYTNMLGLIFNRPQKVFHLRRSREDDTLIKRVLVLVPAGWKLVPEDVADYPAFVEKYLS